MKVKPRITSLKLFRSQTKFIGTSKGFGITSKTWELNFGDRHAGFIHGKTLKDAYNHYKKYYEWFDNE